MRAIQNDIFLNVPQRYLSAFLGRLQPPEERVYRQSQLPQKYHILESDAPGSFKVFFSFFPNNLNCLFSDAESDAFQQRQSF